jgi:hypothetical protein
MKNLLIKSIGVNLALIAASVNAANMSVINKSGQNSIAGVPNDNAPPDFPNGKPLPTQAPDGTYRYGSPVFQPAIPNPPPKTIPPDIASTVNGITSTTPIWNQTAVLSSTALGASFSIVTGAPNCTLSSGKNLTSAVVGACIVQSISRAGVQSKPLTIEFTGVAPSGQNGRFAYFSRPWTVVSPGANLPGLVTEFTNKCSQIGPGWNLLQATPQTIFTQGRTIFQAQLGSGYIVYNHNTWVVSPTGSSNASVPGGPTFNGNGYVCYRY